MSVLRRIARWFGKLWYGPCPACDVFLVDVPGWARADCPKCGRHFKFW